VATILEIQETAQQRTAILDTSVNHMPEVFEYQFEPDVAGHDDEAPWACTLAGATCLAGDVFGQYQFTEPLSVGDRVVFPNSGAYTLVKAHTFNGVNLPTIYHLSDDGRIEMKRRYTYEDYARRWEGGQET
jgi:carboxynorspermidine decarboxylase